jgi:hypothetical protein
MQDYLELKPLLESMLIHDRHGEKDSYEVHSIYLDDIHFNGAQDKAFGNEYHKKYRLRYYNDGAMKLECKEKTGYDSTKTSIPVSMSLANAIIEGDLDVLHEHFNNALIRRFTVDFLKNHYAPKLVVSYQREAYKDANDQVRITFDHSLCGEIFFTKESKAFSPILSDTKMILEVKYEHFLPKELKAILDRRKLTVFAYSKYYYGYNIAYL